MNELDAREETISKDQAIAFIKEHGVPVSEFFTECGNQASYQGETVLNFLNY